MSKPVMTDEEIRHMLIDELELRASAHKRAASVGRISAKRCAETSPENAAEYLLIAKHDDRCIAHYQQAIDLLKNAPMPEAQ